MTLGTRLFLRGRLPGYAVDRKDLKQRDNAKLMPNYIGPFKVLAKHGAVAFYIDLPPVKRCHPVFHVRISELYHYDGTYQPPQPATVVMEDGRSCGLCK